MDALFEDLDKFAKWITDEGQNHFFIALYTHATEANTRELAALLSEHGINIGRIWPGSIVPGTVSLVPISSEHLTVPLLGPPEQPISNFIGLLDNRFFERS